MLFGELGVLVVDGAKFADAAVFVPVELAVVPATAPPPTCPDRTCSSCEIARRSSLCTGAKHDIGGIIASKNRNTKTYVVTIPIAPMHTRIIADVALSSSGGADAPSRGTKNQNDASAQPAPQPNTTAVSVKEGDPFVGAGYAIKQSAKNTGIKQGNALYR